MAFALRVSMVLQEIPEPESLESPLPGGLARAVRFFLDFPQPLQIAGLVVGGLAAVALAIVFWRRRRRILSWLGTRPRRVYAWAAGIGAFLMIGAAAAGAWGWNYVQHDNGFCTGCHVMGSAFVRFTGSEHSQLECHACHRQPVTASMRQLYLWVVERPGEIGEHAPVPTAVCAECHIQEDAQETWQAIAATQGHRVHLASDVAELAEVQCVTCHGQEVHRFVPAEETCAQSSCHRVEDTRIVLGLMSGSQTAFHCLGCHQFTAPVSAAPLPEAAAIVPTSHACRGCHEMDPLVAEFAPASDPHRNVCGLCHDPHRQTRPADAFQTCTTAGCHANPESLTAFHRGMEHGVVDDCAVCHSPHAWVVEGEDCRGCHTELSD